MVKTLYKLIFWISIFSNLQPVSTSEPFRGTLRKSYDGPTLEERLFQAVKNGDLVTTSVLCDLIDPNNKDRIGKTALHYAVDNCDFSVIRLLLEKGAYPCKRDGQDQVPDPVIIRQAITELAMTKPNLARNEQMTAKPVSLVKRIMAFFVKQVQ
jgi:hypothetical protein